MLDIPEVPWLASSATALVCAFAVSLALVLTKRHHGHLTLDTTIGVQKCHAEPTPRVGGVGIFLGLLLAWIIVRDRGVRDILGTILVAGFVPLACGLVEDVTKRVGVLPRLLATMTGGFVAWLLTGVCLNRLDVYGLDWLMTLTPFAAAFTAFAVGGVANAINIIDGFHGVASGTTMIALIALGAISTQAGDAPLAIACSLVTASIGGFWLVNYPWGKLFLGDGGAYFSGFALAWFAVLLPVRNPQVSVWAGLLVCAYPVVEVLYSVVRRAVRRQSPGAPDSGHLHSLINVKLIAPRLKAKAGEKSVHNAAISPIVWTFSSLPAIAATAAFDRPVLLAIGMLIAALIYHMSYRYLAHKESADTGDSFELAGVASYALAHRRVGHARHRARHRGPALGRDIA